MTEALALGWAIGCTDWYDYGLNQDFMQGVSSLKKSRRACDASWRLCYPLPAIILRMSVIFAVFFGKSAVATYGCQ